MPRAAADLEKGLAPDVDKPFVAKALGYVTYAGAPSGNVVPEFIGQELLDTANNDWYRSHGVLNTEWKKLNN